MSSISSLSSAINLLPTTNSNTSSTIGKDLNSLSSALQSGNLTSAQTAFAALTQDLQGILQSSASSGSQSTTGSTSTTGTLSTIQKDLQNVASALKSGDVDGATTAVAKLKTDIQSAVKGHHGGHHHGGGGKSALSSLLDSTNTTNSTSTNSTTDASSSNNVTNTLLNALQTAGNQVNQLA